jgi:hypothetical protein
MRRVGAVLLVPGGQREMIPSRSDKTAIQIVTSHVGFIRMAVRHHCSLGEIFIIKSLTFTD